MEYSFHNQYKIKEDSTVDPIVQRILWYTVKKWVGYTVIDTNKCSKKDKNKVHEIFTVLYNREIENSTLWDNTFFVSSNFRYTICTDNDKTYIIVHEHTGNDNWKERFLILSSNTFKYHVVSKR